MTWESTEETYIDGLMQASLEEVRHDATDQLEKTVNCCYHLYGECTKRRLSLKDEACVHCLKRALDEICFALSYRNFGLVCLAYTDHSISGSETE